MKESFDLSQPPQDNPVENMPAESEKENNPEIEKIEEERGKFFSRIIHSKVADSIGNWVPGVNVAKLSIESALGKRMSGKQLSGKERIIYGLESAALLIAYGAVANEMYGSHAPGLNETAIMGKFLTYAANIYIDKEFVLSQLRTMAETRPETVALIKAAMIIPEAAFSKKVIQLGLANEY
jgi:hypothetical protein